MNLIRSMNSTHSKPILSLARKYVIKNEFLVILKTRRCFYQCTFCTLPSRSTKDYVSEDEIIAQFQGALITTDYNTMQVDTLSLNNEGSMLDERTIPRSVIKRIVTISLQKFPNLKYVSLETRSEFVTEEYLSFLLSVIENCSLIIKIGLESADPRILEPVLGKQMDLPHFEDTIALLGKMGVWLSCYVLLKASYDHNDAEGVEDAVMSCNYIKKLCKLHKTRLTLRINAMYKAEGSIWAMRADKTGWSPPSLFDLARVIYEISEHDVPTIGGIFEEGLATTDGSMEAREDFNGDAFNLFYKYNQTLDSELLKEIIAMAPSGGKVSTNG